MGDPRELEWAKKPDALKESWTARIGTHVYTEFPLQVVEFKKKWKNPRIQRGKNI